MNDRPAPSKLTDELLIYLFDGQSHLLTEPMTTWLKASRRFTAFVNTFRDKIRKKLRVTQDQESLLDLRLELETAYLLLQEPPLSLVYEPQLGQVRFPDFAVTFTTSHTFMVEVTRLRAGQKNVLTEAQEQTLATSAPNTAPMLQSMEERLADAVCSKLQQLPPQCSNVLVVGVEDLHLTQSDIRATMLRVQQRAERSDSTFLRRYRFRDRAQFFQHYQRLSEILVRGPHLQAAKSMVIWVNPQAKCPLPAKVRNALYRSLNI